jgi:hypothetical protein
MKKKQIYKGTYQCDYNEYSPLPPDVQKYMEKNDPNWDYVIFKSTDENMWVVLRCFDEGEEFERHAAIIHRTVISGE